MAAARGIVFDIQRAAMHDGPGIRTTVFLKGCPLRCLWCHNPESQSPSPQRGKSGKIYGREMTVDEVMATVVRDRRYYATSGGGLTVSGGEPTVQFAFCLALLGAARREAIHTCLDTCGCAPWEKFERLLPLVDLFLYDYKATGDDDCRRLTGAGDDLVKDNLARICAAGGRVRLRCPIIPGVNDSPGHFAAIAALAKKPPQIEAIDLMPYHDIGRAKYDDLGRPRPGLATHIPDGRETRSWLAALAAAGCRNARIG